MIAAKMGKDNTSSGQHRPRGILSSLFHEPARSGIGI